MPAPDVPGVLAAINQTLTDAGANITGLSLFTCGDYGYVITDTDVAVPAAAHAHLRDSAEAIWLRTWPSC